MARRRQNRRRVLDELSKEPGTLSAWVHEYLAWQRHRAYSEQTIQGHVLNLATFVRWCDVRSLHRPEQVLLPMLEAYQRHLFFYRTASGRPLSVVSQYGRLTSVKLFFRWLTRRHVVLSNPASELEMPRLPKRLPQQVLSAEQAESILAQPVVQEPLGLRDRAILEVLYATGIRRGEAVRLGVYDLDYSRGTLFVRRGKGNKDRFVPLGERAQAWVQRYVAESRPRLVQPPDEGVLFLNAMGESFHLDGLTNVVGQYIKSSGVADRGSCHLFRHTMATLMLEGGADIRLIQQMLGHEKLDTTTVYTRVGIRQLQQVHAATHPGVRLVRHTPSAQEGRSDEAGDGGAK